MPRHQDSAISQLECFALLDDFKSSQTAKTSRLYTKLNKTIECTDAAELEAEVSRTRDDGAHVAAQLSEALNATRLRLEFRESWQGWLRWPVGRARRRLGSGRS